MASMSKATFDRLIRGVLKSRKDIESLIATYPDQPYEFLLERAVALAETKQVVRKAKKEIAERQEVVSLRQKVVDQDWEELLVQARAVVLCGLPYKQTSKTRIEKTTRLANGKELTVIFTAAGKYPLPFGKDRAILSLITTLASRNGDPRVTFQNAMEVFQKLDLGSTGRDYAFLRASLNRLKSFNCHISADNGQEEATGNRAVVKDALMPSKTDARMETQGATRLISHSSNTFFVELEESFFREVREHGVPIPLEVLKLYTNNPIAWDFVTFLNYRIKVAKNPSRIPLTTLCEMLGTETSEHRKEENNRKMKMRLEKVLAELRGIWPECPAKFEGRGNKAVLYVAPPKDGKFLVMGKEERAILAATRNGGTGTLGDAKQRRPLRPKKVVNSDIAPSPDEE
jgi:hypothetical protein